MSVDTEIYQFNKAYSKPDTNQCENNLVQKYPASTTRSRKSICSKH